MVRGHLDPEDVQGKATAEVIQQGIVIGGACGNAFASKSIPEMSFTFVLLALYLFFGQKR